MGRPNTEFRKGTEFNGSRKDTNDQTSGDRKKAKRERFDGASTSQTISGIAKDMEQITRKIQENHDEMIITLNSMSSDIKLLQKDIDDIRENYL